MLALIKRQLLRFLQWMVSVPMPAGPAIYQPVPRDSKKTRTAAQLKREARKRRNIEKRNR